MGILCFSNLFVCVFFCSTNSYLTKSALRVRPLNKSTNNTPTGKCTIRFNHYKKKFPVFNGVVKWEDVDEEYAFSYVYKGDYRRELIHIKEPSQSIREEALAKSDKNNYNNNNGSGGTEALKPEYIPRDLSGSLFLGLEPDQVYETEIEEDPEAVRRAGECIHQILTTDVFSCSERIFESIRVLYLCFCSLTPLYVRPTTTTNSGDWRRGTATARGAPHSKPLRICYLRE